MASRLCRGFCQVCEDLLAFASQGAKEFSERLLLVPALLAGEFHAGRALFSRNAIWRTAFSASSLDPRVALLHDNGFARHGLADQALGLLPHRLLGHPPASVMGTEAAL